MNWNCCYSPETPNSGENQGFFVQCDLKIWWMTLKSNRAWASSRLEEVAPLLTYLKPCASFHSHLCIETAVTVQKCPIWIKSVDFFCPVWPSNLTDVLENQYLAPLICHIKLCASLHRHMWILTTHLLSIERADWPKLHDMLKACDAKAWQWEFPVWFPSLCLEFVINQHLLVIVARIEGRCMIKAKHVLLVC